MQPLKIIKINNQEQQCQDVWPYYYSNDVDKPKFSVSHLNIVVIVVHHVSL